MATLAEKRRAAAKATGTDTKVPANAGFTIKLGVGEGIGPYRDNDTLSENRHMADWVRLTIDDVRLQNVTNDAIVAVLKTVAVEPTEDYSERLIAAVQESRFMMADSSEVPSQARLAMVGSNAAEAFKYGALIDDETAKDLGFGIEAEKDAAATPVIMAVNLIRLDKELTATENGGFLKHVPPIGSRYQNGKADRAPYGYRLPSDTQSELPVWNGPWDYSSIPNKSGQGPSDIKSHWVMDFVAVKVARAWADRVNFCKDLLNDGSGKDNCPADLLALKGDKTKLQAELDEANFQLQRRVTVTSKALKLVQKMTGITERFPHLRVDMVGVRDYGETQKVAARRRKPYVIVTRTEVAPGEFETKSSTTIATSRIMNMEPTKYQVGAKAADLLLVTRGTKKANTATTIMVPEIATTDKLEEYLSAVSNYADKAENMTAIRKRISSVENAGKMASDLVGTFDLLAPLVTDDVRKLAKAHDDNVARSLAMQTDTSKAA